MGIITGSIVLCIIIYAVVFMSCSPQFGGKITKEQQERYNESENNKEGKFIEPIADTEMNFMAIFKDLIKPVPKGRPTQQIEALEIDSLDIINYNHKKARIAWLGHSSFLIQIDGLNILLDPILNLYASPIKIKRGKRFDGNLPLTVDQLHSIDLVIFSHDHYDHLDYKTVKAIKDKVKLFIVPLGIESHLRSWKVDENKIIEHDWWEKVEYKQLKLVCTPAKHFSGRSFFNSNSTLWSSWCIIGSNESIYFSGDSGYGEHFKEIGDKYGPFDLALMECGQYNPNWKHLHMIPEESVQASIDVKSKIMMPIHWGSFKLSNHDWTDPVVRAINEAEKQEVLITTPRAGEFISTDSSTLRKTAWWKFENN